MTSKGRVWIRIFQDIIINLNTTKHIHSHYYTVCNLNPLHLSSPSGSLIILVTVLN